MWVTAIKSNARLFALRHLIDLNNDLYITYVSHCCPFSSYEHLDKFVLCIIYDT